MNSHKYSKLIEKELIEVNWPKINWSKCIFVYLTEFNIKIEYRIFYFILETFSGWLVTKNTIIKFVVKMTWKIINTITSNKIHSKFHTCATVSTLSAQKRKPGNFSHTKRQYVRRTRGLHIFLIHILCKAYHNWVINGVEPLSALG